MKLRIDGIPLHAVIVHFPVAAWTAASGLTVAVAWFPSVAGAAIACNAVGLATAVAAMVAGFAEFSELPDDDAVRERATTHLMLAGGAWCAYLVALLLQATGRWSAAAGVAALAFVALVAAGHAGARLVFHDRIPRHG